jgi:hypothetical protein
MGEASKLLDEFFILRSNGSHVHDQKDEITFLAFGQGFLRHQMIDLLPFHLESAGIDQDSVSSREVPPGF